MSQEYVVDFGPSMKRWNLTKDDIKRAKIMHQIEKDSVGVNYPVTEVDFLKTLTYSALSSNQDTKKLRNQIFYPLKKKGLIDIETYKQEKNKEPIKNKYKAVKFPTNQEDYQNLSEFWENENNYEMSEEVLKDTRIGRILRRARYGNNKKDYILGFADWWEKEKSQDLIYDILDVVNDNFSLVGVRDRMADKNIGPKGIAEKTASFAIQLLAKNIEEVDIVVVDLWEMRFLKDLKNSGIIKIDIKDTESPQFRGLYPHEYKKYEHEYDKLIERFGLDMESGQLGQALWCKVAKADNYSRRLTDFEIPKPLV